MTDLDITTGREIPSNTNFLSVNVENQTQRRELKCHMIASRRRIKTRSISSLTRLFRPSFKSRCAGESSWSTVTNIKEIPVTTGWECDVDKDSSAPTPLHHGPCHGENHRISVGQEELSCLSLSLLSTLAISHIPHLRCWDFTNGERAAQ